MAPLPARQPLSLRRRWWALLALFVLLVLGTAMDVAFTLGNGALLDALNVRSAPLFWGSALGLAGSHLLTVPLQCSLISVGHRPGLRAFHRRELRLDGQGGWQLLAIGA